MANGEMYLVTWRDAWFGFDEPDPDERRDDYLVRTLGFFVGEDEKFLHLAQEELPAGDGYRAVTHIPISCIIPGGRVPIIRKDAIVVPAVEADMPWDLRRPQPLTP